MTRVSTAHLALNIAVLFSSHADTARKRYIRILRVDFEECLKRKISMKREQTHCCYRYLIYVDIY